ncbi:MAG: glycyl-radical enzyme activating protein [Dehalococcoidales bacterium]|nr:glycyl-radical enzyme activating protein [Dehalococcoidales bacterium]
MNGLVTNIQGYSIHDGPGIRTVVFFKGCGLECRWCSNPECISPLPETGFIKNLCTQCGKCSGVCPTGALQFSEGQYPNIDRTLCTGCGACSEICSYNALVLYGKPMTDGEIFDAVSGDKMFYDSSGGGVTVSGGESLLQPALVRELFKRCREEGIHTCIETSGYVPASAIDTVIPFTDYVLFDLKHLDSEKHREYTGHSNDRILANAKYVYDSGTEMLFRLPLVPGINDDIHNIKETAGFLHGLGESACRIELMPYHRYGKGKYESLEKEYPLSDILKPEQDYLEQIKHKFENFGILCLISR